MKQKVFLTIKGTQTVEGETDFLELQTMGFMSRRNGKYYLSYEETEATGYPGCNTVVKIEGTSKVSMQRFGDSQSLLIMEKGQRHQCLYSTQAGDLTVGIYTHHLRTNLDEAGGEVHVAYSLDINTALASENKVDISVKLVG